MYVFYLHVHIEVKGEHHVSFEDQVSDISHPIIFPRQGLPLNTEEGWPQQTPETFPSLSALSTALGLQRCMDDGDIQIFMSILET